MVHKVTTGANSNRRSTDVKAFCWFVLRVIVIFIHTCNYIYLVKLYVDAVCRVRRMRLRRDVGRE